MAFVEHLSRLIATARFRQGDRCWRVEVEQHPGVKRIEVNSGEGFVVGV